MRSELIQISKLEYLLKLNQPIDVFMVLYGANDHKFVAQQAFGESANYVGILPKNTHKYKREKRKRTKIVSGVLNPEGVALIFDDAWFDGNSFREMVWFLQREGFSLDNIYAYYHKGYRGCCNEKTHPHYNQTRFGTARQVHNIIPNYENYPLDVNDLSLTQQLLLHRHLK